MPTASTINPFPGMLVIGKGVLRLSALDILGGVRETWVLHHLKIGWDPLATNHHQVYSVGLGCLGANHHQVSLTDQGSSWKDEHPVLQESVEIGYPVRLHV